VATTRRLAAIMFTDTVGFTTATQSDEGRSLQMLREQEVLLGPIVASHLGRRVKSTGDGILVEFDSALKATQCAVALQRRLHERNTAGAPSPIQVRIGIHLGDVEPHGEDILGDAVNIAARIEPLSDPGGICLSGAVYEQVWNKIPDPLERLPPKALKGVQIPTDVYRVLLPWDPRWTAGPDSKTPGLAVLPFANISPDPNDEYFADGLTEELITVLSQRSGLRVIARTSVVPYKSTSKGVSQIGQELRVSSILEGSVRKSGKRLRVTAQLIDVGTEGHLWAQTYDRELDDVFAVQSELAAQVTDALKVQLAPMEVERIEAHRPVKPESYLAYLKGCTLAYETDQTSLEAASSLFARAIELDPTNAAATSELATTVRVLGWWYPKVPHAEWDAESKRLAARAVELDPNLAEAHAALGIIHWDDCEYAASEREFRLAISLSPSLSQARFGYAAILEDMGRPDEALRELALAEAADPRWPHLLGHFANLLISLGKLEEALSRLQLLQEVEPNGRRGHSTQARYYLARGDLEGCLREIQQVIDLSDDPRWKSASQALYHALAGQREEAAALLRAEEALPDFPPAIQVLANVYVEIGDVEGAVRILTRAVDHRNPVAWQQLRLDPRMETLRRDPRYQALMKRINLG
jgi:adenylate cyclase